MKYSLPYLNTLSVPISVAIGFRRLFSLFLFSIFYFSANAALAGTQHYQAPLDSVDWQASSRKNHCDLKHTIPLYGQATFSQSAGEKLSFTMQVNRKSSRNKDRAQLQSNPPEWKHQVPAMDLGEVSVHKGDTPFRLEENLSRRMLAELQKGMFPTFTYRDWADAGDEVTVSLPGIQIRDALDKFISCLAELPIYQFTDFKNSLIHFDFGKHSLSTEARKRLDAVAKYIKTDPEVKQIVVDGHTDDIGKRRSNDRLGARRGKAVKEYLIAQGAPANKFKIQSYGEVKPEQSNRTDKGRAQNRRALLTLVK